jgi:DNA modification methylase
MATTSKISDLTPSEWLHRSKSVWRHHVGGNVDAFNIRRANRSCKPTRLCKNLLEVFSKKGDMILDPFAGTGAIAIAAQMAGRQYEGFEIEEKQVHAYKRACQEVSTLTDEYDETLIKNQDFFESAMPESAFDLVFTDPPYFDMDRRKKSKRYWKGKGNQERPMEAYGKCKFNDLEDWKGFIKRWAVASRLVLKPNKYLLYFMEDMYIDGEYIFLTHISADILKSVGFVPQGEFIWYNEGRRPGFFGFPAKMITNRTHSSLIFMLNEKDNI